MKLSVIAVTIAVLAATFLDHRNCVEGRRLKTKPAEQQQLQQQEHDEQTENNVPASRLIRHNFLKQSK
jgi:hypothetical protein